ncbi:hypothetical protein F5878DRAFT_643618 [Lentinula raphanica]|uniref:Uncharacterized protein n=1 Tax=Lentinula raphanica TaxID=153919 RepID=A0AA38UCA7_9AGAR|nr:hypothetical protein F5878DRAFT_643618 [Lentinula raphanica]
MKPPTEDILNVVDTIRKEARANGPSYNRVVEKYMDEETKFREAMLLWIGDNINKDFGNFTYAEESVLTALMCSITVALVEEAREDIDVAMSTFNAVLTSLRDDMAVPRQRNVFELMTRPHDQDRRNHGKVASTGLEESEVSDLTELEESDSEEGVRDQQGSSNTSHIYLGGLAYRPKVAERDEPFERYAKEAREWKQGLDKLIDVSDKEKVSSSITSEIVSIIQAMKKLPRKDYKTEAFRTAVKKTGVAEAIRTICDPTFIMFNHTQQMLWLEHVYRIGDQLGEILDSWTPTEVVKGWRVEPDQFRVSVTGGTTIQSARTFIKVLNDHEELIPGEENISYCFFLTSLDNFRWNYNRWLGVRLVHLGFDMSRFNEENTLHVFYDQLLWQINEWCKQLQRTQDGGTEYVVKQSSEHAKKLTRCDKCEGRPGEERCCQYIKKPHIGNGLDEDEKEARLEILRQEVIGAGVTMVPPAEQLKRNPRTRNDDRTRKRYPGEGQMFHPHSIGKTHKYRLEGMERDPEIMARCGHQLLLVLDEKPSGGSEVAADCRNLRRTEIKDFAWWGALAEDKLALLQDAVVESTGVEPVTRGRQFESYIGGEMTALGSRNPSGGRAGDGYTSYSGLEARTERGLAILFKQAAVSAAVKKGYTEFDRTKDFSNDGGNSPPRTKTRHEGYAFKHFWRQTSGTRNTPFATLSTSITLQQLQIVCATQWTRIEELGGGLSDQLVGSILHQTPGRIQQKVVVLAQGHLIEDEAEEEEEGPQEGKEVVDCAGVRGMQIRQDPGRRLATGHMYQYPAETKDERWRTRDVEASTRSAANIGTRRTDHQC